MGKIIRFFTNTNIILFFVLSSIYIHNLSRSVYGGDVGDLVTAATVMGVPHPASFPLFTFLGFLLTRIDIMTPAFMVGLISAFSGALGVVLFNKFSYKLTKSKLIALISSLILAFNYLYWFYAEIAEVFALNNLFLILLTYLSYLYFKYKKLNVLYLISFIVGLSMGNNYIISFVFPLVLLLTIVNFKKIIKTPKIIIKCILLLFLGFSIYLYIPIAASTNPPVNWGNASNLQAFIDVILRKHYGLFGVGFKPDLDIIQMLTVQKIYVSYLVNQLTIPVIIFILLGFFAVFRLSKTIFMGFLITFLLSGPIFMYLIGLPLSSPFMVGVYERFYSMSAVALLFFLPLGIKFFVNILNKIIGNRKYETLFLLVLLIIPLFLFRYNFNKTNLSNIWVGDNFGYDILAPLPKDSFVFTTADNDTFNTIYVLYALNYRKDLTHLNLNINNNLEIEKQKYLKKYPNFKDDEDIVARVLQELAKTRPVFSTVQIQKRTGDRLIWIPYGLGFMLSADNQSIPSKELFVDKQEKIWNNFKNKSFEYGQDMLAANGSSITETINTYVNGLISIGTFIRNNYKDDKLALKYFERARDLDKKSAKAYLSISFIYTKEKRCQDAINNAKKALELTPEIKLSYFVFYYNNKFCFNNEKEVEFIVKKYQDKFQKEFYKDMLNELKGSQY